MFNFLWKKKHVLPDKYKQMIDEPGYRIFIEDCLNVLQKFDINEISHADGKIVIKGSNNEERQIFIDNLLRIYIDQEETDKHSAIVDFFKKLQETPFAYEYLFKDFEYAQQFLKVLIKPIDSFPPDALPQIDDWLIHKDYPDLLSMLVLDFDDQFRYVRKDEADLWQINYDDLFKIALNNVEQESIEIIKQRFDDKFDVFVLLSGDFSASYSLLINSHADEFVGKYGSLIALPTRGTVFIHPISTNDFMDLTTSLYPEMINFYNNDPYNISMDFYWFKDNRFEKFDTVSNDDGSITIVMPASLKNLLNS